MKQYTNRVVVTIPVYREILSAEEEKSFRRSCAVFAGKYPIVAFSPEGLEMSRYLDIFPQLLIERFPAHFFRSIRDYSSLLLSEEFYERFSAFEWMLVCQLDVWVFRDELEYWCDSDVDFLGAPIPARYDPGEELDSDFYIAGNGGFSLRRISAVLSVLRAKDVPMYTSRQLWSFFKKHLASGHLIRALIPLLRLTGIGNSRGKCLKILKEQGSDEDMVFRALFASGNPPSLTLASPEVAAKFALDGSSVWFFSKRGLTFPLPFMDGIGMKGRSL